VFDICPWQLIDLDLSNFGYQIFVVVFTRQAQRKKLKERFKIQKIEKLPRTFVQSITYLFNTYMNVARISLLFSLPTQIKRL